MLVTEEIRFVVHKLTAETEDSKVIRREGQNVFSHNLN